MSDRHPAPWKYIEGDPSVVIVDVHGIAVCSWGAWDSGWHPAQSSDGHLMARAPTLLAERDALLAACDLYLRATTNEGRHNGRTAIVKAVLLCEETCVRESSK